MSYSGALLGIRTITLLPFAQNWEGQKKSLQNS